MSTDADNLKAETAALAAEFEALLGCYVELLGWCPLFQACRRLAAQRQGAQDGRVSGVMLAAVNYLSQEDQG